MPLPYSRLWARAPGAARPGGARRWDRGLGVLGPRVRPGLEGAHLRDHWGRENLTPPGHVSQPLPGLGGWKAGTRALGALWNPRPRRALPTRRADARCSRSAAATRCRGVPARAASLPTLLREFRNPKAPSSITVLLKRLPERAGERVGTGSPATLGSSCPRAEKVSFPTFSCAIALGCQTALSS